MNSRHWARRNVAILLVLALAVATAGCATTKLPPRLSPEERSEIGRVRFDATVGVVGLHAPHVQRQVVAILQDTGLFGRVSPADELEEPPDLVAAATRLHGGKAIIPVFTILSLGIVPTFFTDDVGYGLAFSAPEVEDRVEVDYHYEARGGLGFVSVALNLLPGWIHPRRRPPERLSRHFAVEIVAKEAEIRALLDKTQSR